MLARSFSRKLGVRRSFSSKINILDEKERADEKYYFSKQDEALLKKIFDKLSADVDSSEGIYREASTTEEKVKVVFMKNGIPPSSNPQLIGDLVKIFG
jgi:hypothetical protein